MNDPMKDGQNQPAVNGKHWRQEQWEGWYLARRAEEKGQTKCMIIS